MDRALSIRQPWATMIALGYKPVENRTWATKYRGDLLIHASLQYDKAGHAWIASNMPHIPIDKLEFPRGGIIASARVVDCVTAHDSPWFFGPVGILLADPHPLPFLAVKGRLGIFPCDYIPFG